jgi:hypothetical protein
MLGSIYNNLVSESSGPEDCVPNLKLAEERDRKPFRAELAPGLQRVFDQLVKMIGAPVQDLPWYHRLGTLVTSFRVNAGRAIPMRVLSGALGPSSSVLAKSMRFVQEYTEVEIRGALSRTGTDWTHLTLAFSIRKKTARHKLLAESTRKKWSPKELQAQVQLHSPTGRRGMGGRRPKELRGLNASEQLKELARRTDAWLFYYNSIVAGIRLSVGRTRPSQSTYNRSLRKTLRRMSGAVRNMHALLK